MSASAARRAARAILAEHRFRGSSLPDPLHGALVTVGRTLSDPLHAAAKLAALLGRILPGGVAGAWVLLAALLIAVVTWIARRRALRSSGAAPAAAGATRRPASARELERAADEAERAGRYADAVRLRFRAGLNRLAERGTLPDAVHAPNRALATRLGSARFDALANRFDQVAYGHADASAEDAQAARSGWSELLRGAR